MTDRLTAETARVGMRVRCVDADGMPRLTQGAFYIIQKVDGGAVRLGGDRTGWFHAGRFIPADPEPTPSLRAILSDRAPELLAACVETHAHWRGEGIDRGPLVSRLVRLLDAIEASGLLAEPSQPAPPPAMFCGADAFTQEDSDER